MLIDEMKCILILLRQAINGETLSSNVLSYFDTKEEFEKYKSNLFTLISINEVLQSFNENSSFSLDTFLNRGLVPELYEQETRVPEVGFINHKGYRSFYSNLLTALKNNDYSFDSSNYLNIYNDDMVATIPQVWLYRLGQAMKKDKYERVYFYNKNKPDRLKNKEELVEYLRRTKTFMVELSTSKKETEPNLAFSTIEAKMNFELKGKKDAKLEDLMKLFKSLVPSDCRAKVSKYKISEEFYCIRRAEQLGEVFYDEPIEVQEKFLNKWLLERANSKVSQAEETQKYILLSNSRNNDYNEADDLDKEKVIPGLFQLYVNLLMSLDFDLSSISLSDFKLKAYMDEEAQLRKRDYKVTEESISREKNMIDRASLEARQILKDISELDVMKDFELISQKRARYVELMELIENSRVAVSNIDRTTPTNDIVSIAFDNEKIMSLINEATRRGRVYLDKNDVVIELYNKDITDPVFKVVVNVYKMLEFVENMNMTLEEYGAPSK